MVLSVWPDVTTFVQGLIDRQDTDVLLPICWNNVHNNNDKLGIYNNINKHFQKDLKNNLYGFTNNIICTIKHSL